MCGITGIYTFNKNALYYKNSITDAVCTLKNRGPDSHGTYFHNNIGFGHTRLAIIDISKAGNQPFNDPSNKYSLIFNGEFYNHLEYKNELINDGVKFKSNSDTEILLYLLIKYGKDAINKINGCFAFAFYDSEKNEILIARDRMGINPLVYYKDNEKIIFASEIKALMQFDIDREIDYQALSTYLQLNYIPTNQCILKGVHKLQPGSFAIINKDGISTKTYYKIPEPNSQSYPDYSEAKKTLRELLSSAVKTRLISDVPAGCFLSGGIDSSVITALAAQHSKSLNTFSIGFKDANFFDETKYANLLAQKYNTNHTEFKISGDDILGQIFNIIDYFDEPFADSSALAVYILSSLTKKKVSVALSGDGADELFAGYNKHSAHFNSSNAGVKEKIVTALNPLWRVVPKSRSKRSSNFIRQLNRFAEGNKLKPEYRYWHWASIGSEQYASSLLLNKPNQKEINAKRNFYLRPEYDFTDINTILNCDLKLVLQGDMLTKVDMMSMVNSLEVRTPFLDHNVVNFVTSLPAHYKINKYTKKKILRESFKDMLPEELLTRSKKGFEVPLLNWLKNDLREIIDKKLLEENFVRDQNIFNYNKIKQLKKQLHSESPGDSHAKVWALVVFQSWWLKYIYRRLLKIDFPILS